MIGSMIGMMRGLVVDIDRDTIAEPESSPVEIKKGMHPLPSPRTQSHLCGISVVTDSIWIEELWDELSVTIV